MQCCARRFHHQTVYDSDADWAEGGTISEAEAYMKCSVSNHGSERLQDNLRPVTYRLVARQFADARAINRGDRW
jgi:hypothetical protein